MEIFSFAFLLFRIIPLTFLFCRHCLIFDALLVLGFTKLEKICVIQNKLTQLVPVRNPLSSVLLKAFKPRIMPSVRLRCNCLSRICMEINRARRELPIVFELLIAVTVLSALLLIGKSFVCSDHDVA